METRPWSMEDVLDTPEMVAEYLNQVAEDGDPEEMARALGHVARARGASRLAREAGVSREAVYASFVNGGNPTISTFDRVLSACGVRMRFEPIPA